MALDHKAKVTQGLLLFLPSECLQIIGQALDAESKWNLFQCSKAMAHKCSSSLESLTCPPSVWLRYNKKFEFGRLTQFTRLLMLDLTTQYKTISLQLEQVRVLPTTLKTLCLNISGKKPRSFVFPVNLTRLLIGNLHANPKIILSFPPPLTSLTLRFRSRVDVLPEAVSTIQYLNDITIVGNSVVLTESIINQIPPGILRLASHSLHNVACFDLVCARFQSLEILSLTYGLKHLPADKVLDYAKLPPNMIRMSGLLGCYGKCSLHQLPRQSVYLGSPIIVFGTKIISYNVLGDDVGVEHMHEIPPYYESIILMDVVEMCPLRFVVHLSIHATKLEQRHVDACRFMSSVQKLEIKTSEFCGPFNVSVCTWVLKSLHISISAFRFLGKMCLDDFMPWIATGKLENLRIWTDDLTASAECFIPDSVWNVEIMIPRTIDHSSLPVHLINKIQFY